MNILLTNDDGISSDGLQKLAESLRSRGKHKVSVIAPDFNRSGISHALSILNGPVKLSQIDENTWSCSGYPAECVILGLRGVLSSQPDIVISGINKGVNLGTDIIYSGTAAAARQASFAGIPALALSLEAKKDFNWDMATSWAVDHLDELLSYWSENSFVNVNIPNSPGGPSGINVTWPAIKVYKDKLLEMTTQDGDRFFFLEAGEENIVYETGSDCDVLSRNFVSISPVYNYPVVFRDKCPGSPDHAAVSKRS